MIHWEHSVKCEQEWRVKHTERTDICPALTVHLRNGWKGSGLIHTQCRHVCETQGKIHSRLQRHAWSTRETKRLRAFSPGPGPGPGPSETTSWSRSLNNCRAVSKLPFFYCKESFSQFQPTLLIIKDLNFSIYIQGHWMIKDLLLSVDLCASVTGSECSSWQNRSL